MADQFVGEIRLVGFNFAPVGWALCNGQLISISQNTALFSLLGTFYGGNGTTNFALPNLQGCVLVHQGQGTGLSQYVIGQEGGEQDVTLIQAEMPSHGHSFQAGAGTASGNNPANGTFAVPNVDPRIQNAYSNVVSNVLNGQAAANVLSNSGGGLPHNNMQPFLVMNYIIALQGIFPARS